MLCHSGSSRCPGHGCQATAALPASSPAHPPPAACPTLRHRLLVDAGCVTCGSAQIAMVHGNWQYLISAKQGAVHITQQDGCRCARLIHDHRAGELWLWQWGTACWIKIPRWNQSLLAVEQQWRQTRRRMQLAAGTPAAAGMASAEAAAEMSGPGAALPELAPPLLFAPAMPSTARRTLMPVLAAASACTLQTMWHCGLVTQKPLSTDCVKHCRQASCRVVSMLLAPHRHHASGEPCSWNLWRLL